VGQTRSFDFERRLRQVVAGSTTTTYIYDGAGKRVAQVVTRSAQQPAATVYIGNLYEEQVNPTDLPHSAYTSYYFLGATLVGLRRANQSASGQYRLVGDHLGSTTLLVDTSGPPTVVQRQYYTPYGTSAYQYTAHGSLTSVDFTGQRLDDSDGLLYFGARYYDAALSYFISADPTVPDPKQSGDLNRYLYARGNPLWFIDASGYGPEDYDVFTNGCVAGGHCEDVTLSSFGDYLGLLHNLFDAGGWGYALASTIGGAPMSFGQWSAQHVLSARVTRNSSGLDDAAARIAGLVAEAPQGMNINIHFVFLTVRHEG
jgi:RHS repeat-associated protein